jgi:exopolyphosphatase/guanosine-5'-triphosphate,3'-diphosphate pyrophosphatase
MILAGIDIGTNTLRLLIADIDRHSFRILHSGRIITRLGEQLDHTGTLSNAAMQRSLEALAAFASDISRRLLDGVRVVATSALRKAENTPEFVRRVRGHTGLEIQVIAGEEEARLTMLGVSRSLGLDPGLVIDIGGGSTEIVVPDRSAEISLPLGAVYLTERFLSQDPPLPTELDRMRREIRATLHSTDIPDRGPGDLVGTAGTVTTLASMDLALVEYDPDRITGHLLSNDTVKGMILRLSRTPLAERATIPGIELGREDIILAGAVIADEIMLHFGYERMIVSDWGLREGIVFDLYDRIVHNNP